ncbi:Flp pilus assembly pilin Flp [Microbacterium arborescens]|nr:Flp pilus assembly pilin Flp [Microbacterium arborescens]
MPTVPDPNMKRQNGADMNRSLPRLTRARAAKLFADESGAATAEYAIATMAAVAFAGLLVVIMRSDEVRGILTDLVRRALTVE